MKELFLKNKNKIHFCLEILMAYLSTFGLSSMLKVPNNTYFVLNENLEDLNDSRSFGVVRAVDIKGKIFTILRTRSI